MVVPKALLLDCDGVLIDSEFRRIQCEYDAMREMGLAVPFDEFFSLVHGTTADQFYTIIKDLETTNREFKFNEQYFSESLYLGFENKILSTATREPFIDDLIGAFRGNLAVVSSSSRSELYAKLQKFDYLKCFSPFIYSRDDVKRPKPDPEIYLLAAREMGVEISQCVVVEDSPLGVVSAVSAGAFTIGYLGSWAQRKLTLAKHVAAKLKIAGAHHVLMDHGEILGLLRG